MESGTLDFDDLMDTGDEYPGFEIAKFTPVNVKDDDSVLRTPEHNSEEETSKGLDAEAETGEKQAAEGSSVLDPGLPSGGYVNGVDGDQSESEKPADKHKLSKDESEPSSEPVEKKKMYLLPPKPKMRLWDGSKNKNKTGDTLGEPSKAEVEPVTNQETGDVPGETAEDTLQNKDSKEENSCDSKGSNSSDIKGDNSCDSMPKTDSSSSRRNTSEEKDNPRQQSFLSFLNLQPGVSKADKQAKQKEKQQEQDFFSRKRLRTRKKVSYVEDVPEDKDDSYEEDEEEDEKDHMIGNHTTPRRRSRSNSGKSPSGAAAVLAKAMSMNNIINLKSPGQQKVAPHKLLQLQMAQHQHQQLVNLTNMQRQQSPAVTAPTPDLSSMSGIPTGQIKGLFECGLCGTFFNTASQFISHQEQAHKDESTKGKSGMETFRCEICQFVLTNRFAYLEHKRMKHMKSQVAFSCNKCGRSFAYLIDLQKHKETCGTPGPYCLICKVKFQTVMHLELHKQKVHAGSAVVTKQWLNCVNKDCTFRCLTQHEMKLHIQNKHMVSELFPCNIQRCSKIFNSRDALTEHKKEQHTSEFIVQYQCMECKTCFSTKTLLAEHQYLHTMDKMRKCDICSRQFATLELLKRHKEVHACKGKLQCMACQRWCFDKMELISHICQVNRPLKNGVRIYFCDICQKDFRADDKLFAHRREHKNYYQCNHCFWDCDNEEDYFEHREKHGIFTCNECCDELSTESDLIAHKKAHKFYVKMVEDSESEEEGESQRFMYLWPNVIDVING